MALDIADKRLDRHNRNDKRRHAADEQNQQLCACERKTEFKQLQQACASHRRNGHKEAELARCRAGTSQQHAAQNRRAGTARTRHKRKRLKRANTQRKTNTNLLHIAHAHILSSSRFALEDDKRDTIEYKHCRHHRRSMQVLIHPIIQRQTNQCTGDDCNNHHDPQHHRIHLQPGHKSLPLFAFPERPELRKIQHDHCKNCTKLNDHIEHLHERLAHLHLNEFIQKNHMTGRADRQPFRNAFHHAKQHSLQRFNPKIHLFLPF